MAGQSKLLYSHEKLAQSSQKNLEHARTNHEQWDSQKIRQSMQVCFQNATGGKQAYEWQLDVAEALLLGLDCTVIAGTGSGKTVPYAMPLLLPENQNKLIIIVSPLKALQRDQARRFRQMGIRATAVNENTFTPALDKEIRDFGYRALFMSPEMCINSSAARQMLTALGRSGRVLACIVDEAHCIAEWGGDFRPAYGKLSQLRALMPKDRTIPFGAFSATLTPLALRNVLDTLLINLNTSYFLNRGNDRPNIKFDVLEIDGAEDFHAVGSIVGIDNIKSPDDIPKTVIFVNERMQAIEIWQYLTQQLRHRGFGHICSAFDFLHGLCGELSKQIVMDRFHRGDIRILVATEAVGMGADIPDIELVIQFGAPNSLAVWIQRAGRAGRLPTIQARAILLIEKSAFQKQKAPERSTKSNTTKHRKPPDPPDPYDEVTETLPDGQVFKKKVDSSLRRWLESPGCRRAVIDEFFHNPPRPIKRLQLWRYQQGLGRYARTSFSCLAVLPDEVIRMLAWDATLHTAEDIKKRFANGGWVFARRHAQDVLDVLNAVDRDWAARDQQLEGRKRGLESCDELDASTDIRPQTSPVHPAVSNSQIELSSPLAPSIPLSPSRARTQVCTVNLFVISNTLILSLGVYYFTPTISVETCRSISVKETCAS
ncbi:P-loop containing nucleoside triphosphate hydrolase protein [Panus rudis PR-1116 ss-1]|nr:P-loop containing nucleoside triphosphate hydrolase protein [Panus rudis PR-1116 ss-1]